MEPAIGDRGAKQAYFPPRETAYCIDSTDYLPAPGSRLQCKGERSACALAMVAIGWPGAFRMRYSVNFLLCLMLVGCGIMARKERQEQMAAAKDQGIAAWQVSISG